MKITENHILKQIIEDLPVPAIIHYPDGRIFDVNSRLLELFNVEYGYALATTADELFPPVNSNSDLRDFWKSVMSHGFRVFEWKARNPATGSLFDVELDLRRVHIIDNDLILGTIRDISLRKKADLELRESEDKFKSLFENSTVPQLLIEGDRFVDCNRKAVDMIGARSKEEIIGLTPALISPEVQPDGTLSESKARKLLIQAIMEKSLEFEWLHLMADGREIYSMVLLTPITIHGKTILHTMWIDITERKNAEQTINESEKRYRLIFEGSHDAIMIFSEGRVIGCNGRALEMFGFEKELDLLHRTPVYLFPPLQPNGKPSEQEALAHVERAYKLGVDRFEWMHQRKDGTQFPAEVVMSSFMLNNKKALQSTVRDITARKKAEKDLQESENRYRLLADLTFEGIIVHRDGVALDVNASFCSMFGYHREELLGRNLIELLFTDEFIHIGYEYTRCQRTIPYEAVGRKKNGSVFFLEIIGKPVTYNGSIARVAAMRDITERKRSEETLRQSELRFRTIFESASDSILILDAETGEIIDANRKAIDMYGYYTVDELRKGNIWLDTPYSQSDVLRLIQKTVQQGSQRVEWRIRNRKGIFYWIDVSLDMTNLGGIDSVIAIFHDITSQKLYEMALLESEEKFRRITESSLDVILTVNINNTILFTSTSITRYTLFKPADLIGGTIDMLLPRHEKAMLHGKIIDAFRGKAIGLFEIDIVRKDGSIAVMEMIIVPIVKRSKVMEIELYARDISDKKKLEKEIIQTSERERQRIALDIHDGLGQTLTGVSIMLGSLARKVQLDKAIGESEILMIAKRIEEAIDTARKTARGLCAVTDKKGGLLSSLQEMALLIKNNYKINCRVQHRGFYSIPDINISNQLYFIAYEATTNALKHSHVKNIVITVNVGRRKLRLVVDNDGDVKTGKSTTDGMGLKFMQYRAHMIGASFKAGRIKNGYRVESNLDLESIATGVTAHTRKPSQLDK